jgi:hypothetical protein
VLGGLAERQLRVELAPQDDGRAEPEREVEVQEAPGVEERGGDHDRVAGAHRDLVEQRRDRIEVLRRLARRPLRRAGGAAREDHEAPALLGRRERRPVAALDEVLEHRVVGLLRAVEPRDEALMILGGLGDQVRELLVVDERDRLLALDDVGDLRGSEGGVEVERVGAELRERHGGLHEAAVVAGQDRDAVARADAVLGEGVGERVGARVDLAVGERAELVDEREAVRMADRAERVAQRRGGAPARVGEGHPGQLVQPQRPDDPDLREGLADPELVDGLVQDVHRA